MDSRNFDHCRRNELDAYGELQAEKHHVNESTPATERGLAKVSNVPISSADVTSKIELLGRPLPKHHMLITSGTCNCTTAKYIWATEIAAIWA